jgi:hypothetical protein
MIDVKWAVKKIKKGRGVSVARIVNVGNKISKIISYYVTTSLQMVVKYLELLTIRNLAVRVRLYTHNPSPSGELEVLLKLTLKVGGQI